MIERWLWAMGGVLGAVMALASVLQPDVPPVVSEDVVATVNGRPILRADYERALAAVASGRDDGVDPALRKRVLDRMIEEELLVQRGLELGLAERDPKVRLDLGAAVIDLLSARGAHLADPSEDELRSFYRERAAWFTRAKSAAVEVAFVAPRSGETKALTRARADEVARRLRAREDVAALVDAAPVEVPSGLLPIAKIGDYLGGSAVKQIGQLRRSEIGDPIAVSDGYQIIEVLDRRDGAPEPFEKVRTQVVAAWRRDAGNRRLRGFLDARREASQVVVSEVL